ITQGKASLTSGGLLLALHPLPSRERCLGKSLYAITSAAPRRSCARSGRILFADSGQTYPGHAYHDALDVLCSDRVPIVYHRAGTIWHTDDGAAAAPTLRRPSSSARSRRATPSSPSAETTCSANPRRRRSRRCNAPVLA